MAVINDPNTAANIAAVGNKAFSPVHTLSGPFPVGSGGAYRISMTSGTIAASLGANSELFQFRYVTAASRVALVHGVAVSAAMIVAPAVGTTPVNMQLRLTVARAWTAAGSGGTRATMTTNNQKMRTSHATSEVNDIGMATTGALTAGTKTLDAQDHGAVTRAVYFDLAAGDTDGTLIAPVNLLGEFIGGLGFPLVLANQEGFVVRSGLVMPATLTWNLVANVLWSEVDSFQEREMPQIKTEIFGPVALSNTLTTNIVAPAAAGASAVGYTATASYIILRHIRIVNKTAGSATCSFWKGATGANTAGTEVIGQGLSVAANSFIDWYGMMRLEGTNGFLVGGASAATTLTFEAEGEVGLV